jgi:hypothetical protein
MEPKILSIIILTQTFLATNYFKGNVFANKFTCF